MPAENEPKPPITYRAAIVKLSELDFETEDLMDGDMPENVATTAPIVAAIYQKPIGEVLEDLAEQRQAEIEEQRQIDKDLYGHLLQDGSSPHDPT